VTDHLHATATAYRHYGCRCDICLRAQSRAQKRWRLRVMHEGPLLIDATGTVRRIQALRRLGYPLSHIAPLLGVTKQRVNQIGTQARTRVHRDMAVRVAGVYDRLSMTLGPDDRARRHAEAQGWPPPLAWDDDEIDDPRARPRVNPRVGETFHVDPIAVEEAVAGRPVKLSHQERREAVRRMQAMGLSAAQIGERLHTTRGAAQRLSTRTRRRDAA
jgi:hypothetical protein